MSKVIFNHFRIVEYIFTHKEFKDHKHNVFKAQGCETKIDKATGLFTELPEEFKTEGECDEYIEKFKVSQHKAETYSVTMKVVKKNIT